MQKEEMITLSAGQHMALIGVYQSLAWDLRFGTRNTQSLKSINQVLRQNFKNKSEAFDFIHRLFKRNNVPTLDLSTRMLQYFQMHFRMVMTNLQM